MPRPAPSRSPQRLRLAALAVAVAAIAVGIALATSGGRSVPARDWVARPYAAIAPRIEAARPGQTVVLPPGGYGRPGERLTIHAAGTAGAPITIVGSPHGTTLGAVHVVASHVVLSHLRFRGPTGPVQPRTSDDPTGEEVLVAVDADDVTITDSEVSNDAWHAGIFVGHGSGVRITRNRIHDNGNADDSAQSNLDHGIYWDSGSGLIADNLIQHNLAHGIQLYPNAGPVTVTQNTIVDNGKSGVLVSSASSGNRVVNNIVAGNRDNGIRSFDLTGRDNTVAHDLIWANGSGNFGTSIAGLSAASNLLANPRLGHGFRPSAGSPAIGAGDPSAATATDLLGHPRATARPTLGAFEPS